jgi:hypothetical protein
MRAVLIHGFNVRDGGSNTVDRLVPYLVDAGIETDCDGADYGYLSLMKVRFMKQSILWRLGKAIEKADVVITHSNGANYAYQALEAIGGPQCKTVIHISPAMNRKTTPPFNVRRELDLITPHDKPVRLSSFLLFHPWGRRGAKGYSGPDQRVMNVSHPEVKGHSDWFHQHLGMTARAVLNYLET